MKSLCLVSPLRSRSGRSPASLVDCQQRPQALTVEQFALSILLVPGTISVSFRHWASW